ncbi:unnamed protein product [Caenorhabditis bovis]|uniref:Uncharacterized protein n=1 Tax=Caenorhabditis bovis TaxID=2654633 RepID=A0A8S1EAM4_9PELO|nr:unnamed protein product [Caenorhabditis bovis]
MKSLAILLTAAFFGSVAMSEQRRYLKMFADAGIGIQCPSGNKVYIHPISGDLQLCKQQLGIYNETSCPGGTACERFPILIPGFQDYCCWSESNPETESSIEEVPRMSKLKPTVTVEPIDEEEDNDEAEEEKPKKKVNGGDDEDDEDIEWEFETTTVKPRRPKNRGKIITTTTPEPIEVTTSIKPPVSRLPQCNNPQDTVLIDYGNRLRDCYFQQCIRGFKCEFNREIRRFICCGQGVDVPPAGLPDIPPPRPLIPRPFRPGPRPFGLLNDGDDEPEDKDTNQPPSSKSKTSDDDGCMCNKNACSCGGNYGNRNGNGNDYDSDYEPRGNEKGNGNRRNQNKNNNNNNYGSSRNSFGNECERNCRRNNGGPDCENGCQMGNNGECLGPYCSRKGGPPSSPHPPKRGPPPKSQPPPPRTGGNNNNNVGSNNRNANNIIDDDYETDDCENHGYGPLPPIPEPKPICQFRKVNNKKNQGPKPNNRSRPISNSGPPPPPNGPPNPMPIVKRPPSSNRQGPPPNSSNNNNGNHNRNGNANHKSFGSRKNSNGPRKTITNGTIRKQSPSRETRTAREYPPNTEVSWQEESCPPGKEFLDGLTSPKCVPPGIDSCPMTHKRCIMSARFGHAVCCRNV